MANPTQFVPQVGTPAVPYQLPVASYLVDGAIDLVAGGIAMLTKASAGAYTLANPYADGAMLIIVSQTAAAHTITYTAGFNGGTTARDVATASAAIGNFLVLVSQGGIWWTMGNLNFTLG